MDISRRTFIKTTVIGGAGVSVFGFNLAPVYAQTQGLKIERTTETRSICPYCSVSCGVIIHTLGDKSKNAVPQVVHVEGDPDAPINRGTLCPKGASLEQEIVNDRRLVKPQVRRPGSDRWEDISWDQAVDEIGEGFEVTGWASVDDLPEAIEDPSKAFALGVQWHPEADPASREIAALVEAARA